MLFLKRERMLEMRTLLHTFLELGDAVSRNLAFAHANEGRISYGEETITETNLLEILRWHGDRGTQLTAVSKGHEAKIGADWEWVVVGKEYTFFMRVQAKRTKRDGRLSVVHHIGKVSPGKQQIDVLIENSGAAMNAGIDWRPVYCFYSKNKERTLWRSAEGKSSLRSYEYGCLIADAHKVKSKAKVSSIQDVEDLAVPWHWLFAPVNPKAEYFAVDRTVEPMGGMGFLLSDGVVATFPENADAPVARGFPTADQLNGMVEIDKEMIGIRKTNPEELHRVRTRERAVGDPPRFLVLDVQQEPSRRRR